MEKCSRPSNTNGTEKKIPCECETIGYSRSIEKMPVAVDLSAVLKVTPETSKTIAAGKIEGAVRPAASQREKQGKRGNKEKPQHGADLVAANGEEESRPAWRGVVSPLGQPGRVAASPQVLLPGGGVSTPAQPLEGVLSAEKESMALPQITMETPANCQGRTRHDDITLAATGGEPGSLSIAAPNSSTASNISSDTPVTAAQNNTKDIQEKDVSYHPATARLATVTTPSMFNSEITASFDPAVFWMKAGPFSNHQIQLSGWETL
ncbi:uncharacterized protein LOC117010747 isoform X5 [Catharus ustulatus]|uniref:uncharacterized protein LOC117010747 isoform X5 n=1 Tax=Catharus ustulatus TaxID=91951 RepID=UPI00140DCEC8|nr:uncharacterized protein LOC117010747 isoform X5 [Catharus ustulatus]